MVMLEQKPTVELIKVHTQHLRDVWRETHQRWRVYDTFYERTFQLWDPKLNRPVVHPAKPKSIVDTAVDQMMGHEPTFERFPANAGEQEQADTGEKALKAMFAQMGLLEPELTLETVKKNLILYGYAVLEDDIDSADLAEHEEDEPERGDLSEEHHKRAVALWKHKQKTLMPFRNRAPHPSDVLMDPNEKNPPIAIKVGKWFAGTLATITANRFDEDGNVMRGEVTKFEAHDNPWELVDAIEYWTEHWHALMLTGGTGVSGALQRMFHRDGGADTMLILEPNTWGFVPFEHAFAGFGHQPTNPTQRNTKYIAIGMLDSIMDDLRMDAQKTSGMHNALMEAVFAKRGTRMDPAELENQEAEGDTVEMDNPGDVWYFKQPDLPRHLTTFGLDNDKDIQEATFNRGLGGHKDVGINTVGQQAIINTAGHRRFIAPTQQINQLYTRSASHFLQWIDILDLDLVIEGNPINRKIINSDYSVKVTHKVVDPVLQMQERQQALTEVQAGVMDLETYWAISGRGDSSGAREALITDLLYAHPTVQEKFVRAKALELGLIDLLDEEPNVTQGPSPAGDNVQRSGILGPDGQPLESTLGTNPLRQPLDSRTLKPSQTGTNLAG